MGKSVFEDIRFNFSIARSHHSAHGEGLKAVRYSEAKVSLIELHRISIS
jgi:hypothetical protein